MKTIIVDMKKNSKKKLKLTPEQKAQNLLKRTQENEIRTIFKNLGFSRVPNIDGKEIKYKNRTSEMDDIFVCENVILLIEYTISKKPGDHIKNKTLFYNKVLENKKEFVEFLISEPKTNSFKKYYDEHISKKYTLNQLKLEILYCSRFDVEEEYKQNAEGVVFFDYHLVQYFKSLSKVIKKTGKYELCDFLKIPIEEFGENIFSSGENLSKRFSGHILPEEKSYFKGGYKIVSFYIDAESLMRRSYVLRQEGWRKKENIGYYQRMFEPKKISNMRKYLSDKERVFINNIITTISEDKIKLYDEENNELKIDNKGQFIDSSSKTKVIPTKIDILDECNIIGLIDGQHRTYAYHEGDDIYEDKIKNIRGIQNLLVTGIIFPRNEKKETRLKFEANLFLEINSNQTNVKSQLKQEIELMVNPFSSISIGKAILLKLNEKGPFEKLIEQYSFEKRKLKTSSIVDYGLKPLIKLDETAEDSLFHLWSNSNKLELKIKDSEEYELLEDYIKFCTEMIRDLFISIKINLDKDQWNMYSYNTQRGILNVTFFNGILNVLRLLIENDKINDFKGYNKILENQNFNEFKFKSYKSSQYRKMGEDIYNQFFK